MAKATQPAIVTDQGRPIDLFKKQLELAAPTIMKMVPAHMSHDKFQAMVVTAVAYNTDLLECTTASLLRATAQAAELGLSLNPSLKEADILRVRNGKLNNGQGGYEAQMRPRFGGLMKLARQSGDIRKIESVIVYERDFFKEVRGTQERLDHEPYSPQSKKQVIRGLWKIHSREPTEDEITTEAEKTSRGFKTHVYCTWELTDGTKQFEVMTADDVERIRARSPASTGGPWVTDEDEMWRKTVVRRASKYMPMSSETFKRAVDIDNRADAPEGEYPEPTYTDVTEEQAPPATTAGQRQAAALADRVAPASPKRIDVPDGFDGPDYQVWQKLACEALGKLREPGPVSAWMKVHANILRDAPPDVRAAVEKAAAE